MLHHISGQSRIAIVRPLEKMKYSGFNLVIFYVNPRGLYAVYDTKYFPKA